jgi:hypothetical protein
VKEGKAFFFEEKKQKTFMSAVALAWFTEGTKRCILCFSVFSVGFVVSVLLLCVTGRGRQCGAARFGT